MKQTSTGFSAHGYADIELLRGSSTLTDGIKQIRTLLFSSSRVTLYNNALMATVDERAAEQQKTETIPATKGDVLVFDQVLEATLDKLPNAFWRRAAGSELWQIAKPEEKKEEKATDEAKTDDASAVKVAMNFRASLDAMMNDLINPASKLLVPCPNKINDMGENREKFVPTPSARGESELRRYFFLGKVMGVAMRSKTLLNLHFPGIVWKALVGDTITKADVVAIDALSFSEMDKLREIEQADGMTASTFNEHMSERRFVCYGSDGKLVPLMHGGEDKVVTWVNRQEYHRLWTQHRLNEFEPQCNAMRQGLATVVPCNYLPLLSWQDLEEQVCGKSKLDLDLLQKKTEYQNCSVSDAHVQAFWQAIGDLSPDDQTRFVQFVCGRSRLPVRAEDFERNFIVHTDASLTPPDGYLPKANTW